MNKILSTDDVNVRTFQPHGRVEIVCKRALLQIKAIGPFNMEIIEAIGVIESDITNEIIKEYGSWSEVVTFENSSVVPLDALEALEQHLFNLVSNNSAPKQTAFVIPLSVEGSSIMPNAYRSLYRQCGIDMEVFTETTDALRWLK